MGTSVEQIDEGVRASREELRRRDPRTARPFRGPRRRCRPLGSATADRSSPRGRLGLPQGGRCKTGKAERRCRHPPGSLDERRSTLAHRDASGFLSSHADACSGLAQTARFLRVSEASPRAGPHGCVPGFRGRLGQDWAAAPACFLGSLAGRSALLARARLCLGRARIPPARTDTPPQLGKESSAIGSVGLADERPERCLHELARLQAECLLRFLTKHDLPTPLWIVWILNASPIIGGRTPRRRVNLTAPLGRVYRLSTEILGNSGGIVPTRGTILMPK